MAMYVALPSVCGDCLFLNCCTWIGDRDCTCCKNGISKDEYLRRINQRIRPAKREGATM